MEVWRDELYHHGIKGQRWGIRRYQNEDGSYTEEGKIRRSGAEERLRKKDLKKLKKTIKSEYNSGKHWYSNGMDNLITKESTEFAKRHIRDADIARLREKRLNFEKYKDVVDYEWSEQYEKDQPKIWSTAYKNTLTYFKENHPDKLKEWLSLVGGNSAELDRVRDFEHVYEAFADKLYENNRQQYERDHPEVKKAKEAWNDYYTTSREIGKSFVKDLEDTPITINHPWADHYRDVISKSIDYDELIKRKIP